MQGINYIVDESGDKKAVIIDLNLHKDLWNEIKKKYDLRDSSIQKKPMTRENLLEYAGSIDTDINPDKYQEEIRNEWG